MQEMQNSDEEESEDDLQEDVTEEYAAARRGLRRRRESAYDGASAASSNVRLAKRQRETSLSFAEILQAEGRLAHVNIKEIIKDFEKDPMLHLRGGNHRQRRSASQSIKKHIAEAYSPPRVCAKAEEMGLKAGVSMDLTTTDEDGKPWDFSSPEMRNKSKMKVDEEKPEMLVVCPMC